MLESTRSRPRRHRLNRNSTGQLSVLVSHTEQVRTTTRRCDAMVATGVPLVMCMHLHHVRFNIADANCGRAASAMSAPGPTRLVSVLEQLSAQQIRALVMPAGGRGGREATQAQDFVLRLGVYSILRRERCRMVQCVLNEMASSSVTGSVEWT